MIKKAKLSNTEKQLAMEDHYKHLMIIAEFYGKKEAAKFFFGKWCEELQKQN